MANKYIMNHSKSSIIPNELQYMIEQGTLEQVEQMLSQLKSDEINYTNKLGYTALHQAVKNGDEQLIKLLNKYNCDLNKANNSGQSALFMACWLNKIGIVKLLIQMGSNINSQDNRGWTALMISAYNGLSEIVKILLQNGADPRISDSFQKKPVDRAKDPYIIQILKNAMDEFQLANLPQKLSVQPVRQRHLTNTSSPTLRQTQNSNMSRIDKVENGRISKAETDEDVQSATKRNFSLQQQQTSQFAVSQTIQSFNNIGNNGNNNGKFIGVKDLESANTLKQLTQSLIIDSQIILQNSIRNYNEITFQTHLAQYEESVWNNISNKIEQRLYITFDCLQEYLALKLKVAMAHLGVKLPSDLMFDYQQEGAQQFQEGFARMISGESKRLRDIIKDLQYKQSLEQSKIDERLTQITSQLTLQQSNKPTNNLHIYQQNLCKSFQEIMNEIMNANKISIDKQIEIQCKQIESRMEEHLESLLEKQEREMKIKVESLVNSCVNEVQNGITEVDSWITRKNKKQISQDRNLNNSDLQINNNDNIIRNNKNNSILNNSSVSNDSNQINLHKTFQNQNNALKEKLIQLKTALSPNFK